MTTPCTYEHRIENLEVQFSMIQEGLKKMEDKFDSKLDLLLFQMNKIAVLEASHSNHSAAVGRAFDKLSELEKKCESFNTFKSHTEGMAKMAAWLWAALSGAVGFMLIKLVF